MDFDNDIITYDFIIDCWKKKSYPENFNHLLENYIQTKSELFKDIRIAGSITAWLSKILIAIEIGEQRNDLKFSVWRKYWEDLLGRKWRVSIEDGWVFWA